MVYGVGWCEEESGKGDPSLILSFPSFVKNLQNGRREAAKSE
jgi:hypothetical protein